MKLDFKRILSFVLALVMTVGTLTVVNVSSVFAVEQTPAKSSYNPDTGEFLLIADDFANGKSVSDTATLPSLSSNATAAGIKFGSNNRTYKYQNYGTEYSTPTNEEKYTFDKEFTSTNNDTITFTPKKKGTLNVYLYNKNNNKTITIDYTTIIGNKKEEQTPERQKVTCIPVKVDYYDSSAPEKTLPEVKIALSSTGITLLAIEYVADEETNATGWELDFSGSDVASEMQSKIGLLDDNRTQSDNWLTYSGNDYIVNPDREHITEGRLEGTVYKYTPMMSDFIKTVGFLPNDIEFTNADGSEITGKRYVNLDCEIHGDSVHTIYIENGKGKGTVTVDPENNNRPLEVPADKTDGKIWLPEDTYYVSIAGGKVEMSKPTVDETDKTKITINTGDTELKGKFTADTLKDINDDVIGTEIDLTAGLKVNDGVDEAYIADGSVIGDGYFQVNGNQNNKGDFALIRSEHMSEDGERSNVEALELKTMVDNSAANSSLRFHISKEASPNLSIRVICSSSDDTDHPSKIGLRTGNGFADTPNPVGTPETIPAEKNSAANTYTFTVENLNPDGYYGIYNAGTTETEDDVRIYRIEFYKAQAPATATPEAAKYAFKAQAETTGRLVTKDKKDPGYNGAYANNDSDKLYVEIADKKAVLHDTDNKNSVEMIMPLVHTDADGVTSGTVKFSGDLTLKNNVGSKWSLLDFIDSEGKTVAAIRVSNGASSSSTDYHGDPNTATGEKYSLAVPYEFKSNSTTVNTYDYYETSVVKATKSLNYDITFDYTNSTITLNVNNAKAEATSVSRMPAIAEIKAITGSSAIDRDYEISDIDIEATSATKYTVKLSGNNNAGSDGAVTLKLMKGTQQAGSVEVKNGAFSDKEIKNLSAGTYTLAADGCVVTPKTITVRDNGEADTPQSFTDINIETSYNVTALFNFASDSADADVNISITKLTADGAADGSAKTIKAQTSFAEFEDVAPGTQFKISGTSRNTYQWLSRRNGVVDSSESFEYANKDDIKFFNGKSSKYFVYTVPDNETVKSLGTGNYGVQFKAEEKIVNLDLTHKNIKGKNNDKTTSFGQYGFGEDKKKVCGGKDARDNVAEYRFETAGMDDYISHSYCATVFNGILTEFAGEKADITTGNEFGILNKDGYGANTFIKFKVDSSVVGAEGEEIQAIVDRSGDAIEVFSGSDGSNKVGTTDIMNTKGDKPAKQVFTVKAGETYTIKSSMDESVIGSSKKLTGRTYVKSIRIYNPNNIFDNTSTDVGGTNTKTDMGTAQALSTSNNALYTKIQADNADPKDHIFRVIGTIHLSGSMDKASAESELANIEAVGFDVYKESDYKEYEETGAVDGNHVNANSTLKGGSVANKTPLKVIEFKDVANSSVDTDGDKEANMGTTDGTMFSEVYVQTFYAASEAMVLVPWVQYKSSTAKVYSLIKKDDPANNIVLDPSKA